jgi:integrase
MASLFKRNRSPFWWVKYRDPFTGKIVRESTGFKFSIGPESRRAKEVEAERTLAERATARATSNEAWGKWVPTYLAARYSQSTRTRSRFESAWRSLRMFFTEHRIAAPRNLTREHCNLYFTWRLKPDIKNGKYRAGHNTALLEIKILSLLMKEAVRRGYAKENPARDLGIKRAPRKLYPELTDQALQLILDSIPQEPEKYRTFLLRSFLIARWHGVRLTETLLNPQTQVWQQEIKGQTRWMILFHQKGNREKPKLLHPELIPLLSKLKQDGAVQTYEPPDRPSRVWFNFLKKCGVKKLLPNACFHSLRVTAATRMARAGVPLHIAMEYLTHASTTIHQAYIRWQPEDMEEAHGAVR